MASYAKNTSARAVQSGRTTAFRVGRGSCDDLSSNPTQTSVDIKRNWRGLGSMDCIASSISDDRSSGVLGYSVRFNTMAASQLDSLRPRGNVGGRYALLARYVV